MRDGGGAEGIRGGVGEGGGDGVECSFPCSARCVEARLIQRGDEELGVVPYVARLRQARILLRDRIGDALRDARLG